MDLKVLKEFHCIMAFVEFYVGQSLIVHIKHGPYIAFGNPGDFEDQEYNLDIVDFTENYEDEEL
ncbi:MAG: hypothetical protein QXN55_00740 [Candidatus Nitrosotenuis sp.]